MAAVLNSSVLHNLWNVRSIGASLTFSERPFYIFYMVGATISKTWAVVDLACLPGGNYKRPQR